MQNRIVLFLLAILSPFSMYSGCISGCGKILEEVEIEFGYYAGRYISIDKNYSEMNLFLPLSLSQCCMPFLDVSGYRFNDGKWAVSTGLGMRVNLSPYTLFGMNLYYDTQKKRSPTPCDEFQQGGNKYRFEQIGVGFEWLSNCWDIRINGYFPLSPQTRTVNFCVFDDLGDGFFATNRKVAYAYSGIDAEIGKTLFGGNDVSLYGAIGPYYYQNSKYRHFAGGTGRVELWWKSFLSLQCRMTYDNVYSTNFQGAVLVSFPLDFRKIDLCSASCEPACPVNKKVHRNGIILMDHCCDWEWNWDDSSR